LGQVRTEVVGKAVDRRVDIALGRGDDAIVIPRYPLHLGGVGIEQPLLKVSHIRLKRSRSLVDVEIDFILNPAVGGCAERPNRWIEPRWEQI
jgi:hypothetical protein